MKFVKNIAKVALIFGFCINAAHQTPANNAGTLPHNIVHQDTSIAKTPMPQKPISAKPALIKKEEPVNVASPDIGKKAATDTQEQKATDTALPGTVKPAKTKPAPPKKTVNEIRAVVYGSGPMTEPGQTARPVLTVLILTLDIERPWIDGRPRTLRDLILENLMIFDAQRINQSISDEDIDKVLNQIQKNYNYTHEQLEDQMKLMGYTFDEFREQLRRKQLVDRILEYRIHSDKRLMFSQADIQTYWDKNGPIQEAMYSLSNAIVKTTDRYEDFEKKLLTRAFDEQIEWEEPIKIAKSELPQDKIFITEKNVGDIVFIEPVAEGFEITKLVLKTEACKEPLKTGDKEKDAARSNEITRQIKQSRFAEIMESYQADLLAHAKIDFKYKSDRDAVLGKQA